MTADVPSIRPYATREEWRRDFHVDTATHRASSRAGLASIVREESGPTAWLRDTWDILHRETGDLLGETTTWRDETPWVSPMREVAYNRRTGEVVYGGGVQS